MLIKWEDLNWWEKDWVKGINKSWIEIKVYEREIKKSVVFSLQENGDKVKFPPSTRENPVLVNVWTKWVLLPKVLFYKLHKFIPFFIIFTFTLFLRCILNYFFHQRAPSRFSPKSLLSHQFLVFSDFLEISVSCKWISGPFPWKLPSRTKIDQFNLKTSSFVHILT